MFSLKNNLPDPYITQSRDFQLLCNGFDMVQNASKFDIDSILNIVDTDSCPDSLLLHLQRKLGFFINRTIPTDQLRVILKGFPYIIKNKGTLKGILLCTKIFLSSIQQSNSCVITVNNEEYRIEIGLNTRTDDLSLLREMLQYVAPTGYTISFYLYSIPTGKGDRCNTIKIETDEVKTFVTDLSKTVADAVENYAYQDISSVKNARVIRGNGLETNTELSYISDTTSAAASNGLNVGG